MNDKLEIMDFSKFLKEADGDIKLASKRYNDAVIITQTDIERELKSIMAKQIADEIDQKVMNDLLRKSNE